MTGVDWLTALAGGVWLPDPAPGPLLLALLLFAATFVLEDAAILAGTALAAEGALPAELAFTALALGIVTGDLGLYLLGRLAGRTGPVRRLRAGPRGRRAEAWLRARLVPAVLFSRLVPGLRLPTYVAAGAMGMAVWLFTALVLLAGLVWTGLLFGLGVGVGPLLGAALGLSPGVAGGLALLSVLVLSTLLLRRGKPAPTLERPLP